MNQQHQNIVLLLSKAIISTFSSSEWTELGYLTNTDEYIQNHSRLLRSLAWGDDDYKGHAIDTISYIIDANPKNLQFIVDYEPIIRWFERNKNHDFEKLVNEIHGLEITETEPTTKNETVLEALADAQALLRTRGPVSAVDRIHTALHAYLKIVCQQIGITPDSNASANQLLKILIEKHPALQNLGPRSDEISRILRTSGAIIDAFGSIRNQSSRVHPNEDLLDKDEALFVMNIARSVLQFFDAKLPPTN